ncbi:MAG: CerR family C-terminal domain-containing protein [Gemmatimonas sp.]
MSTDTRERLLLAAMQVFAVGGYEQGTIRDITQRASANQAAVNYHFGSKAALYEAVVQRAFEHALVPLDSTPDIPVQGRAGIIRALVSDIVQGALRELTPATHLRIITAEILRPTGALKLAASDSLAKRSPQLARKLKELSDKPSSDSEAILAAHWLLGSCLIALQLAPKTAYGDTDEARRQQQELTEHLSALLLNGMNGLAAA